MRLVLIRHGHTSANALRLLDTQFPGADLDETGRRQADGLAQRLADEPIDAVYSSDLVRARQTAAPLAAARGLTVTVLPGLREIQAGDEEGAVWGSDGYVATVRAWGRGQCGVGTPGGEDGFLFFDRFDAAIAAIAADNGDDARTAALVSHGAALRVWCSRRVDGFELADGGEAGFENTGYAVVEGDPDAGWRLVRMDGVHRWD